MKSRFQGPYIQFYWNSYTHLPIGYGCFHSTKAEVSRWDTDGLRSLKYSLSGPLQNKFADFQLNVSKIFKKFNSTKLATTSGRVNWYIFFWGQSVLNAEMLWLSIEECNLQIPLHMFMGISMRVFLGTPSFVISKASGDLPSSASQSVGITRVRHCTQPTHFKVNYNP